MAGLNDFPRFAVDDAELREVVRELGAKRITPELLQAIDGDPSVGDGGLWEELVAGGWHALCVPDSFGGAEATLSTLMLATFELGRVGAPVPWRSSVINVAAFLSRIVDDHPEAADLLRQISEGRTIVSVGGKFRDGDLGLMVEDLKAADGVLLVLADFGGTSISYLEAPFEPLRRRSFGNTAALSLEWLEGRFDTAAPLIRGSVDLAQDWLALRRLGDATWMCGLIARVLQMAVDHVREREQFGRPIGSFQAVHHQMAEVAIWLQMSVHALTDAWLAFDGSDHSDGRLASASSLALTRQAAALAVRNCHHVHGGLGYTLESDLHLYTRRLRALSFLGDGVDDLREELAAAALEWRKDI